MNSNRIVRMKALIVATATMSVCHDKGDKTTYNYNFKCQIVCYKTKKIIFVLENIPWDQFHI